MLYKKEDTYFSKDLKDVARFFEVDFYFAYDVCRYNNILSYDDSTWLNTDQICKLAELLDSYSNYKMIGKRLCLTGTKRICKIAESLGISDYMQKDGLKYQLFTTDDAKKIVTEYYRIIDSKN